MFQGLIETLRDVARRHDATGPAIAARYTLQKPAVAAVILGAAGKDHLSATTAISGVWLDDEDRRQNDLVLAQRRGLSGEVYALGRDRNGPHGRIMK